MAPLHASLCLNLMHTFALRRDDLTALCWGLRYLDLLAASGVQAARGISAAVRGEAATAEAGPAGMWGGGGHADALPPPRGGCDGSQGRLAWLAFVLADVSRSYMRPVWIPRWLGHMLG